MAFEASDDVQSVATGNDPTGLDPSIQALLRRLPNLKKGKPQAQPGGVSPNAPEYDGSTVAGAADAGSGPNGSGRSSALKPAAETSPVDTPTDQWSSKSDFGPVQTPDASAAISPTPESAKAALDIGSAPVEKPQLAEQAPHNPLLKFLSRISGQSADTPKPGEAYSGPTTPEQKHANMGSFLTNLSRGLARVSASVGTPQQKTWAQQEPLEEVGMQRQLALAQNEMQYRRGMLDVAQQKADTGEEKLGVQKYGIDTRAGTERSKLEQSARLKGYITDEKTGQMRPMSEQEVSADPMLSQHRELQSAMIEKTRAQADLSYAQNDPTSPIYAQKQRALDMANRKVDIELGRLGLATRSEDFKEGVAANAAGGADRVALSPAAQKILMETGPVKSQIEDLMQKLSALKDNNTPAYFAAARAMYTAGIHSDQNDLAGSLGELELSRVTGAARVLKGSSRAYQVFEKALKHTPNPWVDSPMQMYNKLDTIYRNLNDIEGDAYKFGAKSGAVPVQKAPGTGGGAGANANSTSLLTKDEMKAYIQKAGGDVAKAKQLAQADGRKVQ